MTPATSADYPRTLREAQLRKVAAEFVRLEMALTSARRRRTMLALDLLSAGLSERAVGNMAGVSGAAVHQWRSRSNA
jgi:hypothetical protein